MSVSAILDKATIKLMDEAGASPNDGTDTTGGNSPNSKVNPPTASGSPYADMDVPTLGVLIQEKLMPGQGVVPEGMWQTIYPDLCANQYSVVAMELKNLQLANRVHGECQKAIKELQKKLP